MAHGLNAMLKRGTNTLSCKSDGKTGIGSRRIFAPQFKLQVLDSYRNDADCKGNQRATARKYGIHRRQIQKWLQVENNLRNSVIKSKCGELIVSPEARKCGHELALRSAEHRQRDDVCVEAYSQQRQDVETTGAELELMAPQRIGGADERDVAAADKRVPDIPQQHSPDPAAVASYATLQRPAFYEWPRHGSPDDTLSRSSRSGSERDIIELFGSPSSHCSPSPPSSVAAPFIYSPVIPPSPSASLLVPALASRLSPLCPSGATAVTPFGPCDSPEVSSSLPLDFTTHSRRELGPDSPRGATTMSPAPLHPPVYSPVPAPLENDSAAPLDLSLKKPYVPYPRVPSDLHAPVTAMLPAPHMPLTAPRCCRSPPPPPMSIETDSQIWDLSTKGVKRLRDEEEQDDFIDVSSCNSSNSAPPSVPDSALAASGNRPIKLFKPYLDNIIDEKPNSDANGDVDVKPIIVAALSRDNYSYTTNNNNMGYKNVFHKNENYLHDDINNHHINFYCPDYYPSNGYVGSLHFDDVQNSFFNKNSNTIKQRQSYSLDFKLSAIECYYSDTLCRGNQRAVASKFKIHRRQVQKWLKQEDQLRQRNETTKPIPMHIVR